MKTGGMLSARWAREDDWRGLVGSPVAVGTAVSRCPPHRPVLAALPHTVLTLDLPPQGGWRGIARLDAHEQRVEQVANDRIVFPVSPRWAAFGCAVPAHGTSSGRP